MTFNLTINQEKKMRQQRRQKEVIIPLYVKLADLTFKYRACQIGVDKTTNRRDLVNEIDKLLEQLGYTHEQAIRTEI